MIRLSAFADEISPDLDEQIAVLFREGINHLDLRSVSGTNVLDLDDRQVADIKRRLDTAGVSVAAIGSPIGKVPIDSSREADLQRLDRAIALAEIFGTPFIRIFSFYPPASAPAAPPSQYRQDVLERLEAMTARARGAGVILTHENEKGIYGDTIDRTVDLLQSIGDPHFQAVLDPANFIQCGQRPYPDAYRAVRPWLCYVHVKDARPDGEVVAAGEGVADWPVLLEDLRASGYDWFLSLEPHLQAAGPLGGFSGPELFHHAASSLQRLLRAMDWEYA